MKTVLKILLASIFGLATAWFCYQVGHLDQTVTTVATVLVSTCVYGLLDKIMAKREN